MAKQEESVLKILNAQKLLIIIHRCRNDSGRGGGLISFMATRIAKPIRDTDAFFRDISEGEGDLTARLHGAQQR